MISTLPRTLLSAVAVLAAIACVTALGEVGRLYLGFRMPQSGLEIVPVEELTFFFWYAFCGVGGTAALTAALAVGGAEARLQRVLMRVAAHPRISVLCAGVATAALALVVRFAVLREAPVSDDELTYLFEARTLLQGRVLNPTPDAPEFFRNQFVLANERGWFGKYPLGHPLLLALGDAARVRALVVPTIGAAIVALTFAFGRRLIGVRRAALGACLLLVSPHFVATLATQHSQPSAALFLLLGLYCAQRFVETRETRWGAGAGAALGFAFLVRPLPSALVVGAVFLALNTLWRREGARPAAQLGDLAPLAPGIALGLLGVLLHNHAMTGSVFSSGYQAAHGAEFYAPRIARVTTSLGGAMLRENFWLFGWTLSLVFVPWARPARSPWLFWGPLAAAVAYRVILPKTVVSTTGPIYMFEAVPCLALATADGAIRASEALTPLGLSRARVASLALSASVVGFAAFVPMQVRALARCADARDVLPELLARAGARSAVIFGDHYVSNARRTTWAMFPPNPSPDLSDPVVHLRLPVGVGGPARAHAYWRRRFSDRRAFVFEAQAVGARFVELSAVAPPDASLDAAAFLAITPLLQP